MNQRFKIVNWKKYQHYKDRRPPWIKLYSKLLRKYEFLCLQDDSKLLLILLWLFASTLESNDPQVPSDTQYLKSVLPLNGKINLQPLIQYGFIEMIADCKQNDSTLQATCTPYKEETYTKETETDNPLTPFKKGGVCGVVKGFYSEEFESLWKEYPKKVGKGGAYRAWNKIKPDKATLDRMIESVRSQKKSEQWKREGGQFIPNPETWLNQRRWEDEVEVKAQPRTKPHCVKCGYPKDYCQCESVKAKYTG